MTTDGQQARATRLRSSETPKERAAIQPGRTVKCRRKTQLLDQFHRLNPKARLVTRANPGQVAEPKNRAARRIPGIVVTPINFEQSLREFGRG